MRILAINKTDKLKQAVEVSEADLKAYLKYTYPYINEIAWREFVEKGRVTTPTTAYYDVDHEAIKEAIKKQTEGEKI